MKGIRGRGFVGNRKKLWPKVGQCEIIVLKSGILGIIKGWQM